LCSFSASRGLPYLPADKVAQQTLEEILKRVTAAHENDIVAASVLGAEKKPSYKLSEILDLYIELMAVETKDKGRDQRRIWENTLKRSFTRLISVVGNKNIEELCREDIFVYRSHWAQRIQVDGLSAMSANRELTAIAASTDVRQTGAQPSQSV
jgi:hypothetical protein